MPLEQVNFQSVLSSLHHEDGLPWAIGALEPASIGVILIDPDWKILYTNPLGRKVLPTFSDQSDQCLRIFPPRPTQPSETAVCCLNPALAPYLLEFIEVEWQAEIAFAVFVNPSAQPAGVQIPSTDVTADSQRVQNIIAISGLILTSPTWRSHLGTILSLLGNAAGADRVSLFLQPGKEVYVTQRRGFSWQSDDLSALNQAPIKTGPLIRIELTDWNELLQANQVVQKQIYQLKPHQQALFNGLQIKSTLLVPVFAQQEWCGTLEMDCVETERTWLSTEVDRLKKFTRLIGARIQKERAEEKLQSLFVNERNNYASLGILHEIGLALNAIMDVEVVLDRLLGQARQLIPLDFGSVYLLENGVLTLTRLYETQKNTRSSKPTRPSEILLTRFPILQHIVSTLTPVLIHSLSTEPEWISPEGKTNFQSWIGAPIVVDNRVIGLLSLYCENEIFTSQHLTIIASFAQMAARAMTNARLFDEVAKTLLHEQRLNEITQIIASTLDLETVLHTILRLTTQLINADSGLLALTENENRLKIAYTYNLPREFKDTVMDPTHSISWDILRNGYPILLEDYSSHPQALPDLITEGVQSYLGVPLIAGNEALGVLSLFRKVTNRKFKDQDRFLAEIIARQAGIAIQNAHRYEEATRLATRDSLTGLYNRRHFFELANREFDRSMRYERALAVIMLDLDNLKQINDTFGHQTGDRALQIVAQTCVKSVRRPDLIGRYGGDEFVMLLPETTLPNAVTLAERLVNCVGQTTLENEGAQIHLSISLGVADLKTTTRNLETLIEHADQAQYQAKQSGKGKFNIWGDQ